MLFRSMRDRLLAAGFPAGDVQVLGRDAKHQNLVARFLFMHPKLERLVIGDATVLIHQGKLQRSHLTKERLSTAELEAAARRQGFPSLKEVEEAVLEPGGIITFTSRHPDEEHVHHRELMERMEQLSQQIAALRPASSPPAP